MPKINLVTEYLMMETKEGEYTHFQQPDIDKISISSPTIGRLDRNFKELLPNVDPQFLVHLTDCGEWLPANMMCMGGEEEVSIMIKEKQCPLIRYRTVDMISESNGNVAIGMEYEWGWGEGTNPRTLFLQWKDLIEVSEDLANKTAVVILST